MIDKLSLYFLSSPRTSRSSNRESASSYLNVISASSTRHLFDKLWFHVQLFKIFSARQLIVLHIRKRIFNREIEMCIFCDSIDHIGSKWNFWYHIWTIRYLMSTHCRYYIWYPWCREQVSIKEKNVCFSIRTVYQSVFKYEISSDETDTATHVFRIILFYEIGRSEYNFNSRRWASFYILLHWTTYCTMSVCQEARNIHTPWRLDSRKDSY